MEEEVWKDIAGYEGKYKVSNYGNIYSVKSNRTLLPLRTLNGYLSIMFGRKTYSIHRIVATTFLPNPNNYKCVNHKNGNKTDNRVENLEWCNHTMNLIHAYRNGLNRREKPVECLLNGNIVKRYRSAAEAEEKDGFQCRLIVKCCKGERKHHGGYEWRYENKKNV